MSRKVTKVLLSLMVAFVCMCNCSMNVFAKSDSFMTKEEVMEKYSVDTGNTQVDELYNTFLGYASVMASEDYEYFINYYEILASYYQERYIKYCNGTVEEWDAKEGFEKFLWDVLYVSPLQVITDYSYDKALESFQQFYELAVASNYDNYSKVDMDFANSYLAIMEWQYYYIVENNAVYNYMTAEDSLGNTAIGEITDTKAQEFIEQEAQKNEESANPDDTTDDKDEVDGEKSEEEGIWDDTIDSVKSRWLTFAILGILVVALIGVVIYRKSKGIDDDKVA